MIVHRGTPGAEGTRGESWNGQWNRYRALFLLSPCKEHQSATDLCLWSLTCNDWRNILGGWNELEHSSRTNPFELLYFRPIVVCGHRLSGKRVV